MNEGPVTNEVPWEQAEGLRAPGTAAARDPRNRAVPSLEAQHAALQSLLLNAEAPERIRIAFDTARNLYLYSWHVYRFYPVAELHALSALEAGLRLALPARLPPAYQPSNQKSPMLSALLRYAIDQGKIRDEGFGLWRRRVEDRARQRRDLEIMEHMVEQDLTEMEIGPGEPLVLNKDDRNWSLVEILSRSMPSCRNSHAHGSGLLSPEVFGTLELVAEVLNQLYPSAST